MSDETVGRVFLEPGGAAWHDRASAPSDRVRIEPGCRHCTIRVKVDPYGEIEEAVRLGLMAGWNLAHADTDEPTPEEIREQQRQAIMLEIDQRFEFPGNDT